MKNVKENKILRKHLHKARSSNLNAYIRGGTLYANAEAFTSDQLAAKEGEDPFDVSLEQRPSSAPPTPDTRDSNLVDLADASPSNDIALKADDITSSTPCTTQKIVKPLANDASLRRLRSGSVSDAQSIKTLKDANSGKSGGPPLRKQGGNSKIGQEVEL
ncbi:hypothetical protein QE152_g25366 [Popillia japonica]|uniref:Uncharacterized protein n=1 Tax=Popillia japonica TaxID=7064 RepID=A0AAW1K1X6_POPJA